MFDPVDGVNRLNGLLDELLVADLAPVDDAHARQLVVSAEEVRRRLEAVQVRVLEAVDASGSFAADGHPSAKVMVRHVAKLSAREAAARARSAKTLRDLPEVEAAFRDGSVGVAQVEVLGRVHANPRVRAAMVDAQGWFLRCARRLSFHDFEAEVRQWERLADADGPEPANSRTHDRRDVQFVQEFDLGWRLGGGFAAMQGAQIDEIYAYYIDAERLTDWEKARAEHGDEATAAHLPRTEAQRRADALWKVFQDAAGSDAGTVPAGVVHNIVWNQATFDEALRRLAGHAPTRYDPATYRCETLDGVPLEPVEAAADALTAQMRRVVIDAAGVTIDLGRARFFTGGARLAAQLNAGHCVWPGCQVPTSRCEVDHTRQHGDGGRTVPGNGAPLCGRHNRWKQKGFSVTRDPAGTFCVHRPDGSRIE